MAVGDDTFVVAICVFELLDVLRNQVCLDAVACDVGKGGLEDRHFPQCRELVDKKQDAVVRPGLEGFAGLKRLLQFGVPHFFEFLGQSVHRHGENKSEQGFEALDVAWRHNKVKTDWIFEMFEVVDREVAILDAALNERIAVKDECCFCRGQYTGELLVLSVEHLLHFFDDDRMYKRLLAVAEIPIACEVGVWGRHGLGEVFADNVYLLRVRFFQIDGSCQVGHKRRERVGKVRQRGKAILSSGDIA